MNSNHGIMGLTNYWQERHILLYPLACPSPQSYHGLKHGMRRVSVLILHDLLGITAGKSDLGFVYEATRDAKRLRDGVPSSSSLAIHMVQHKWSQGNATSGGYDVQKRGIWID